MSDPQPNLFGPAITVYRKQKGLTLRALAVELEKLGYPITPSTINKYELGLRSPGGDFVAYFQACLKLSTPQATLLLKLLAIEKHLELLEQYKAAKP